MTQSRRRQGNVVNMSDFERALQIQILKKNFKAYCLFKSKILQY